MGSEGPRTGKTWLSALSPPGPSHVLPDATSCAHSSRCQYPPRQNPPHVAHSVAKINTPNFAGYFSQLPTLVSVDKRRTGKTTTRFRGHEITSGPSAVIRESDMMSQRTTIRYKHARKTVRIRLSCYL